MQPCLLGISLNKGCIIIGSIQIFIAIAECVFYTLGLTVVAQIGNLEDAQVKEIEGFFVIPFVNFDSSKEQYKIDSNKDVGPTMIIVFSLALVGSLAYGMIGFLLIYSTKKRNLKLLKLWTILQLLVIILAILYLIITLILGYTTFLGLILDFMITSIQCYFWLVGYSLIMKLTQEQSLTVRKSGETIDISFPPDAFTKF